ncbi:MAG: CapA family protein [Gordonia sp. (in: high G+C Gram-positive bacteria)]|uniref:CapA family protein n=1 Tax=Gordonia sp. (in: high G+C Gram-positive bacteria) TaxID=84139 RepID=UPI003BB51950
MRYLVALSTLTGALLLTLTSCSSAAPNPQSASSPTPSAASSASSAPGAAGTITLSWAGDNILGSDPQFGGLTLPAAWKQSGNDPNYFFQNVKKYFDNDDLTIANFEVSLTTDTRKPRTKPGTGNFFFNGDPALAATLPAGGIEVVTIANNHTWDYGRRGFNETTAALDGVGVKYVGYGNTDYDGSDYDYTLVQDVKGIKVGLASYQTWQDTPQIRTKIRADMAGLRQRGADVVIPYFHWGIEAVHEPYGVQQDLARVAIDAGADAVIGTHPHVLQSMDVYKGKLIAYSLGNFAFGGNTNPTDKRTAILQTKLHVVDGAVRGVDYRVIPTRVSRTEDYNDYVPTPYTGAPRRQVLTWLNGLSPSLNGTINDKFTPVPQPVR